MTTKDIYELYGNVPIKYTHCDEYTFMYQKVLESGLILRLYLGGDCEKLFRELVSKQSSITLNQRLHYYARLQKGEIDIWQENVVDELKKLKEEINGKSNN